MRAHEPGAVLRVLLRAAKELGMNEIDRADVEGCRHANLAAEFDHPFGEIEAGAPVIETAVDMRRLDVDEGARVDRFGEAHKEPHGEGRAAAMRAAQEFAIERGEIDSHWRRRYGAAGGGGQCALRTVINWNRARDRSRQMPLDAIGARLRAICLALPEANEELMRRGPSYRVADKIFALERPWNDGLALWCKVPEGLAGDPTPSRAGAVFHSPIFWRQGLDRRRLG